jgi:hypothetical protein
MLVCPSDILLRYYQRIAMIGICRRQPDLNECLLFVADVDASSDGNVDFMQSFSKLRDVSSVWSVFT